MSVFRAIAGLSILLLFASICRAQEDRADSPRQKKALAAVASFQESLAELIEKVEPTVVAISRAPAPANRPTRAAEPNPFEQLEPLEEVNPFGEQPLIEDFSARASVAQRPVGAGVIIDSAGLVLTQYLNVSPGELHRVTTSEGETYEAEIKGSDPRSGLAVLELKGGSKPFPAIELGDADKLRKGHFVVTVSNPYAIAAEGTATVSWGMVTNLSQRAAAELNLNNTRDEVGQFRTTLHHFGALIQTDAKLGWSSSGGALIDLEGRLVGITTNSATIAGHEVAGGYAIPLNQIVRRAIDRLKEGREVEYGLLGVRLGDVMPRGRRVEITEPGATVQGVLQGSAADRAGLQPLDHIIEVNGRAVGSSSELQYFVGGMPPGETVNVLYIRDEEKVDTKVTLSKYFVPGNRVVTNRPDAWRGIHVDYSTAIPRDQLQLAVREGKLDYRGCVVVVHVEQGSAAWQAGVRPGRFISHVGETRVSTPKEFRDAIASQDGTVDLRFTDDAEPQDLQPKPAGAENSGI